MSQEDAKYLKTLKEEATFYYQVQQFEQSRKAFLAIAEILLKHGHIDIEYAQTLGKIGQTYKFLNKFSEALAFLKKGINVLDSLSGTFNVEKAAIKRHIAEILYLQQDYEQSERCLMECQQLLKQSTQAVQLSFIFGLLGTIKKRKQQYDAAVQYFMMQSFLHQKFYEVSRKYADKLSGSLTEIGTCFFCLGKYAQALTFSQRAMALCKTEGLEKSTEYALSLITIGYIYRNLNQKQPFFLNFKKALPILQQSVGKDHPDLLPVLSQLGIQYSYQQQPDQALPLLQRYLSIYASSGYNEDKFKNYAIVVLAVATIHLAKHNWNEALKYYHQCLEIYQNNKEYQVYQATILIRMADAYNHLKDFSLALDCAKRSLAIYGEDKGYNVHTYVYEVLASIYKNLGNTSESQKYSNLSKNGQANAANK